MNDASRYGSASAGSVRYCRGCGTAIANDQPCFITTCRHVLCQSIAYTADDDSSSNSKLTCACGMGDRQVSAARTSATKPASAPATIDCQFTAHAVSAHAPPCLTQSSSCCSALQARDGFPRARARSRRIQSRRLPDGRRSAQLQLVLFPMLVASRRSCMLLLCAGCQY